MIYAGAAPRTQQANPLWVIFAGKPIAFEDDAICRSRSSKDAASISTACRAAKACLINHAESLALAETGMPNSPLDLPKTLAFLHLDSLLSEAFHENMRASSSQVARVVLNHKSQRPVRSKFASRDQPEVRSKLNPSN
jgi:hypothetical protein